MGAIPSTSTKYAALAEWLGSGLQIQLHRFDSVTSLQICVCGEMVNAQASRACSERFSGSSPDRRTKYIYNKALVLYNMYMGRIYTKKILEKAVLENLSFAGVLRSLGIKQAGGSQTHITNMIRKYNIDTSHFTGARWNKGKTQEHLRKTPDQILVELPKGSSRPKVRLLRRAMLESGVKHLCSICLLSDRWQNKPLVLEVDHIDGNSLNNLLSNLRFLCPNCHSQQKDTNRPHKYAGMVER